MLVLSQFCFAIIFSSSLQMIFFFQEVVVLILMKSNSSVFPVMTSALGVVPKKLLPNPRSLKFSMFSSRIFTVLQKEFHGQRSLVGYSQWDGRKMDRLSNEHFTFSSIPL